MVDLKAGMKCLSLRYWKEACRMMLMSQWCVIMMYCCPLQESVGKRPQSSEYSLLMVLLMIWSSFVGIPSSLMVMLLSISSSRGLCVLICGLGGLGFVDRMPCWLCVMWPLMVSADTGKYLDVLA